MSDFVELVLYFADGSKVSVMGDSISGAVTRAVAVARELEKTDLCRRIERK